MGPRWCDSVPWALQSNPGRLSSVSQAVLGQNRAGGKNVTNMPRGTLGKSQPWSLELHIASRPTPLRVKSLQYTQRIFHER
jgi:hypothetical protein